MLYIQNPTPFNVAPTCPSGLPENHDDLTAEPRTREDLLQCELIFLNIRVKQNNTNTPFFLLFFLFTNIVEEYKNISYKYHFISQFHIS